jgi:hypothetical protein
MAGSSSAKTRFALLPGHDDKDATAPSQRAWMPGTRPGMTA